MEVYNYNYSDIVINIIWAFSFIYAVSVYGICVWLGRSSNKLNKDAIIVKESTDIIDITTKVNKMQSTLNNIALSVGLTEK